MAKLTRQKGHGVTVGEPRKRGGVATKRGIIKEQVCVRKGIYHVPHVYAYHKRLKKRMERFRGVATKHSDNYRF